MKTSQAANLVLHWIFVLNTVKHKFFHMSIVKFQKINFKVPGLPKLSWCQHLHELTLSVPFRKLHSFNKETQTFWRKQNLIVQAPKRTGEIVKCESYM